MGSAPLGRLLLSFSGPAIVAMLSGALYNLADAAFVGRLGSAPLAGITVAFPPMMLIMALATGTGVGAGSVVARAFGANERQRAKRTAGNAILLTVILGLLTPACLFPTLDPLLRFCGASDAVLPLARNYFAILAATSVITYFVVILSQVIRAEGNVWVPMVAQIAASIVNIALDPLFIFTLGMGIEGAAWATVLARFVGLVIQAWFLLSKRSLLRPRWRDLAPDFKCWREIYSVGMASVIRTGVQAGIIALVMSIAARFGDHAVAAVGIAFRYQLFVMMPCFGITQGFLPIVGFNYGAKKKERVRKLTIMAAGWSTLVTATGCALYVGIPHILVKPFAPDPELAALSAKALRWLSMGLAPAGAVVLFSAFFQGIGKGFPALVISSARQLLFLLPTLLIFPRLWGLNGLFMSQPVADFLSVVLAAIWITYQFRVLGIPLFKRHV